VSISWLSGGVLSSAREVEAHAPAAAQTASKMVNDRRYLFTSIAFFLSIRSGALPSARSHGEARRTSSDHPER
jgi:hypothetical protein